MTNKTKQQQPLGYRFLVWDRHIIMWQGYVRVLKNKNNGLDPKTAYHFPKNSTFTLFLNLNF